MKNPVEKLNLCRFFQLDRKVAMEKAVFPLRRNFCVYKEPMFNFIVRDGLDASEVIKSPHFMGKVGQ
jgi:hypothetical protein